MGFSRQEYWSGVPLPSPGRKARGLQTEETGCKYQMFSISLKRQEEINSKCQIFFPISIHIKEEVSLKILCCHDDT